MMMFIGIILGLSFFIILVCALFCINRCFLMPQQQPASGTSADATTERSVELKRVTQRSARANRSKRENPSFAADSNPNFV